ncbi:MAG: NAD(P)H-hydrate dehydratase [Betaproteobacteria bacterium]|nr:NAD(P)H-hydrate dehydratase [Betaproteobacteria bacterium]
MFRIPSSSQHSPWPVWPEAALRRIERVAAQALEPHTLMQRAGRGIAALTRARFPHQRRVLVLCGPGNNGGDGLAAASMLAKHGMEVEVLVVACGDPTQWTADRRPADWCWALDQAKGSGVRLREWGVTDSETLFQWAELIIDALMGLGLNRAPEGELGSAIAALHRTRAPVLAADLPSGLSADTGTAPGLCVHAQITLTFLGLKPGLLTGPSAPNCGELWLDTLDCRHDDLPDHDVAPSARLVDGYSALAALPSLHTAAHKGQRGDVRVFGGSSGMAGAALLCARSSLAMGAGRVFAALFDPAASALDPVWPELMLRRPAALLLQAQEAKLRSTGCDVFGPGAGTSPDALGVLESLIKVDGPLVIDADGLNLLAAEPRDGPLWRALRARTRPAWLTPHPREAARLLQWDTGQVQANRLDAAAALVATSHAHCVLKGAGSVIAATTGELWINPSGNGLLATAGTGDVLAGALAAFLAHAPRAELAAAQAAVWLHGAGADCVMREQAELRAGTLPQWMLRAWAVAALETAPQGFKPSAFGDPGDTARLRA